MLCSCSSAIGIDDLTRALALGARDARIQATVFDRAFQGADHPVPAAFPEGLYLKSLLARIEPAAEPRPSRCEPDEATSRAAERSPERTSGRSPAWSSIWTTRCSITGG